MAVSVIYEIADVLKIKFAGTIGPQNWPRGLFLWWDEVTFSHVNKTNQQCSIMTNISVDQQCPLCRWLVVKTLGSNIGQFPLFVLGWV